MGMCLQELIGKGGKSSTNKYIYDLLVEVSKHIERCDATFPPHKQKRQAYAAKPCDIWRLGWSTASM